MASAGLIFFERVGHQDRRPSPFSWRTRFALAHKRLEAEIRPTRFQDVAIIESLSGQHMVPVIQHNGKVINDSWEIACYLEDTFHAAPSLFDGAGGRSGAHFVSRWVDEQLHPAIRNLLLPEFVDCLDKADRDYYRHSREALLGCTLESFRGRRDQDRAALVEVLRPLEAVLARQPWVSGEALAYADYVVLAAFQWARLGSPSKILTQPSAVLDWRQRSLAELGDLVDEFAFHPETVAADKSQA